MRRTTRTDVGLALAFVGIGYLVWAFVIFISRRVLADAVARAEEFGAALHPLARGLNIALVNAGLLVDIIAVAWLTLSLVLVVLGSRQMISISWAWVSALCQSFVASIAASLIAWSAGDTLSRLTEPHRPGVVADRAGSLSLPVFMAVALVIWTTFLVWLLVERARIIRRGPTLSDGLRSNVYK